MSETKTEKENAKNAAVMEDLVENRERKAASVTPDEVIAAAGRYRNPPAKGIERDPATSWRPSTSALSRRSRNDRWRCPRMINEDIAEDLNNDIAGGRHRHRRPGSSMYLKGDRQGASF